MSKLDETQIDICNCICDRVIHYEDFNKYTINNGVLTFLHTTMN